MNAEKVRLLVRTCITYGRLGYLEDQELICLYDECKIISQYFGDTLSVIQLCMILSEVKGVAETLILNYEVKGAMGTATEKINAENICLLVRTCITYGHLGYLNLEDQELICLYEECLIISQYFGDILSVIQLCMLLDELPIGTKCFKKSSTIKTIREVSEQINDDITEAIAFLLMSERYRLLKNLPKVIECCEKAIDIAKNPGFKEPYRIEGMAYGTLSSIYRELGKYHKMKECSENYLKICKETRNKELEGIAYVYLGVANFRLGKLNEAISSYEESIKIALQLDYKQLLEVAYSHIAHVHQNLSNMDQAETYLEKSLKLQKEMGDSTESIDYLYLGSICQILGKYQEAMDCYQKGLNISTSIGDKKDEGTSYMCLGDLYWTLGKYHKAIQCLEKGLELFKDIGNRMGEGEIYLFFAGVYNSVGKFQDSLENLNKSLAIAFETGETNDQINCYGHLGIVHQNLKKYEKAMEYYVKCLDCALEIGNKMTEGKAYCYIGYVHLDLSNYEEAIKYFDQSINIASSIKDKEGEGYAYHRLGLAYACTEKYDEAIRCLKKSFDVAMKIGNRSIAGHASSVLGWVYYDQSEVFGKEGDEEKCQDAKEKSEEKLKEALQCWEWKFTHLKDRKDFKISIVDTFIKTLKALTEVLIKRQKTDEALLISDRGRARSLGDILATKYGITEESSPSQMPLDCTDVESVLSSNQSVCILFFGMPFVEEPLHAWVLTHQKPIVFVNTNNQAFTEAKELQLEKGHSNVEANIKERIKNVVNEFHCELLREMKTARCENRSFESTEDSGVSNIRSEHQPKESAIDSVERNVDSVGKSQRNVAEQKADQLEVLFSLLVTPLMQHLQQEEIVIIPEGPLYMVPFAALRDPTTGKYLSETKSIRISPSLATLKALRECTVDYHSKKGALIVGDPDVGEVIFEGETKEFDRLPSAKREAVVIAALLNTKPLIGSQATKEMVKKKLQDGVAVIHIAAHGDSEHGHIALAPPPRTHGPSIPEEQDYMLTMQEVQEIGVTAQLVVLSCCHSGRGDIKAEGVVGMSRAFLAAGARAVVASLWAIDDYATLSFMVSFYSFLKMGESASKSLQKAMDDIRGEEGYEDPMYWAPFFLIGDDVTISV